MLNRSDSNMRAIVPAAMLLAMASFSPAESAGKTVLVLDASGSMWGQIAGKAKITIAQEVIREILEGMAEDTALGLYAYGHRQKGQCSDIERLVAAEPGSKDRVAEAVGRLKPKGKTPLSDSIVMAAEELKYQEDAATVILVSDGRETCDRDPCAVARALEEAGADFTAHVIGFDVAEPEDIRQLSCIAEETGGTFYSAQNAGDLVSALETVVAFAPPPAPEPEPEPALPARELVFEDEFEGSQLARHWFATNKNPDLYTVDGGSLQILSTEWQAFLYRPRVSNAFFLGEDLPDGNWDLEFSFTPEARFESGTFMAGLALPGGTDNTDVMQAALIVEPYSGWLGVLFKKDGDNPTGAELRKFPGPNNADKINQRRPVLEELARDGVVLRFKRRGRQYYAELEALGEVFDAGVRTSLKAPKGKPFFTVGLAQFGAPQVFATLDAVRIYKVNE